MLHRLLIPISFSAALIGTATAHAAPAPNTGVELGVNLDQVVATQATVDFGASRTEGIAALKRLRGEMWDQNVPFDGDSLRNKAAQAGLNSRDAYVGAVASDTALTAIAVQRAFEETVNPIDHSRPGPSADTWSATWAELKSGGENLAWASNNVGLTQMILQQWGRGELSALRAANGFYTTSNGHLYMLLNPKMRAYGFGYVNSHGDARFDYVGATAAYETVRVPDNTPSQQRTLPLYRAARNGEQPTGVRYQEVVEGRSIALGHTASLWGGTGGLNWTAPEVDKDTLYWVDVPGTWSDGATTTTDKVPVMVKNRLSDQYQPVQLGTQDVREGKTLNVAQATLLQGLPAGTRVEGLDWVAPEVDADTDTTTTLTYTYSDGSQDKVQVPVRVRNKLADVHQPLLAAPATVVERQTVTLQFSGVPAGTKVEGADFKAPSVAADSTVNAPVTFRYSDDSSETIEFPVSVKDSLADQNPVATPAPAAVNEGESVTVEIPAATGGATISLGEVAGAQLDGTTLTYSPGQMNGDKTVTIPVTYTYPDGSTNVIEVVIAATDLTPPFASSTSSEGTNGSSTGGIIAAVVAILGILGAGVSFLRSQGILRF